MTFSSLSEAVRTAIKHGNTIPGEIFHAKWAITYNCTPAEVKAEFERQLTKAEFVE